ncbi:arylamine N-acetyltransferase 2 [Fusarium acuminatum]|uniref:Arylamine N-acetyltransferase 2 n=1 Tax=Fusarium acuminatum TaxID=5515 RepID=A0ABZ2X615_9HYPO
MEPLQDSKPSPSAYSAVQLGAWLRRIGLPRDYLRYIDSPVSFPRDHESLKTLFRCQITTFPYENLSVHYSHAHQVIIQPHALFEKMMKARDEVRGGYCMELSIFFYHMLCGLGFDVYMTGVRNRTRRDGVPQGEYQGCADVAFGGDGPTSPLRMDECAQSVQNLGSQKVRLIHEHIPKQRARGPKLWIYQYRNRIDQDWNSYYSFSELEFFQEDFEVQNWWTAAKTLHRHTVLVVRFLRQGQATEYSQATGGKTDKDADAITVVGKIMLVNDVIKVNFGGKTQTISKLESEEERLDALKVYFGISLTPQEADAIRNWDTALPSGRVVCS